MATRRDALAVDGFTLVLSGGYFGFFAHTGLLAALEEAGLRPRRVVGCSAGALAGGAWAAGVPAAALEERLATLRRDAFWDPGLPLGGLLRGRRFEARLTELLAPTGVRAIERCPLSFTAVVHDLRRLRPRALVCGPLARALRASCAVPLLFRPVRWRRTLLVDGGVSDRSGLSAVRPGERVLYHHLIGRRPAPGAPGPKPPWARALPPACEVLAVPGLPRVSPFALERGPEALRRVREATRRWLAAPAAQGVASAAPHVAGA